MNKTELNEALARYRKEFGATSTVQPWDVRNLLVLGEDKFFKCEREIRRRSSNLSGMDLSGLWLDDMFFDTNEKFVNTVLIGAHMVSDVFISNDMSGVDFSYADLHFSEFKHCNLSGARFEGACLIEVKFVGCNLSGCTFTKDCGAEFIDCYGLPWLAANTGEEFIESEVG
ncbi:MAG: pentapeptide repeat-containing protein [Clostridia bacterium]|nr:pentapeptide repeat-containing protein [Clostridia bacterium]